MIKVKSPLRVDLAGGTLDCWPLYLFVEEAWTINIGINLFSYVELIPKNTPDISIQSKNFDSNNKFSNLSDLLNSQEPHLKLVQEHIKYWKPKSGFELIVSTDSPIGGGLAGSSSLSISLIKAFLQLFNKTLSDQEMVRLACNIETRVLGKPAGTQDYIPALSGGLNFINYTELGIKWKKTQSFDNEFNRCAILVYTGKPHHSGLNNWDVISSAMAGDRRVLDSLKNLSKISLELKANLEQEKYEDLVHTFKLETNERLKLAASFSSSEIEQLISKISPFNAALKICGAGGGGCVLIWCPNLTEKLKIESLVEDHGLKIIKAQSWSGV